MDDRPAVPGPDDLELAGLAVLHGRLASEQRALLEVVTDSIGSVLGDVVRVERRGLLNTGKVKAVAITLEDATFELRDERGQVRPSIGHTVGGVVLSRQPTDIDTWLAQLFAALDAAARRSERVRAALSRLV